MLSKARVKEEQTSENGEDEKSEDQDEATGELLIDHCINCNSGLDNTSNKVSKIFLYDDVAHEHSPSPKTEISVTQAISVLFQFEIEEKRLVSSQESSTNDIFCNIDPLQPLPKHYVCKRCGDLLEAAYNAVTEFKRATKQGSILSSKFGKMTPSTPIIGQRTLFKTQTGRKIYAGGSKSSPGLLEMKKHKCHICKKSFSTVILLNKHCKLYHAQKKKQRLLVKEELKEEMEVVVESFRPPPGDLPEMNDQKSSKVKGAEDKPAFKCDICGKLFLRSDHCQLHLRTHTGGKPYSCHTCGKAFSDPRGLSFHEITHSNERPFCCTICGQTFKRRHHLNDHEKNHHREAPRPFKCSLCGKAFKHKKHLNSHVVIHREKKEHQCSICLKTFSRKDNLSQHIRKVHEKPEEPRGTNRKTRKAFKTSDFSPATSIIVTSTASVSPVVVSNLSKPVITLAQLTNPGKQAAEEAVTVSIPDISPPASDSIVDGDKVDVTNTIPVAIAISEEQIVYMHL